MANLKVMSPAINYTRKEYITYYLFSYQILLDPKHGKK